MLRAGSKNTPLLQRRILIGAFIVLIAAFGAPIPITSSTATRARFRSRSPTIRIS
jgi:hypothetical protein